MDNKCKRDQFLQRIYIFLDSLPICYTLTPMTTETFLPGIKIQHGTLLIDTKKLVSPGDILHEAGHIAVSLPEDRRCLSNNITTNNKSKNGEEMAVMLWSYAAALHIGIQPEVVFHKEGYKGEHIWILEKYRQQTFMGLPLLQWMGLTYMDREQSNFPKMKKWLRI